jgi:hypothetical protein
MFSFDCFLLSFHSSLIPQPSSLGSFLLLGTALFAVRVNGCLLLRWGGDPDR